MRNFFHTKIPQKQSSKSLSCIKGEARRSFSVWWQTFDPKSCPIWSFFVLFFAPAGLTEDFKSLFCMQVAWKLFYGTRSTNRIFFLCAWDSPKKIYQLLIFWVGTEMLSFWSELSGSKTIVSFSSVVKIFKNRKYIF